MKKSASVTECPKCGGEEFGRGKQSGYSAMQPVSKMGFGSTIEYIICVRCGFIIEGYVKKPGRFRGTY